MTDYYSVIDHAVAALTENTINSRHTLYDRARAAHRVQLQRLSRKTAVGNYLFLHIRRALGHGYLARWTYPNDLWAIDEFSVNQIVRNELLNGLLSHFRFGECAPT